MRSVIVEEGTGADGDGYLSYAARRRNLACRPSALGRPHSRRTRKPAARRRLISLPDRRPTGPDLEPPTSSPLTAEKARGRAPAPGHYHASSLHPLTRRAKANPRSHSATCSRSRARSESCPRARSRCFRCGMRYLTIGTDPARSRQVSRIALGAMLMGTATDESTSYAILDRYVEAGGTFIDTANNYAYWVKFTQ
jgi:hypothetical protein